MVLTTKEASYIIVFGIVISVLPISSTLLQDGYHVHFEQNSKQRRRGDNQTSWISSKQICPINLLCDSISVTVFSSSNIPVAISEHIEPISEANPDYSHRSTLHQAGGLWQRLCEAVGEHLSSRYIAQVDLSISSYICSKIVPGRNVCNCTSAVDSVLDTRDQRLSIGEHVRDSGDAELV
jgi:hypothetical protein